MTSLDFVTGGDQQYLITGSDDCTAKVGICAIVIKHHIVVLVAEPKMILLFEKEIMLKSIPYGFFRNQIWDLQRRECIFTLEARSPVCSVLAHPNLPVLVTGTKHGIIHVELH